MVGIGHPRCRSGCLAWLKDDVLDTFDMCVHTLWLCHSRTKVVMVTSNSTTSIRLIGPNVPTRLDVSERYLHIPICILRKDTFTNTCAYGVSHHCRTFLNTKMPKIKIIKNHSLLHENFAKKSGRRLCRFRLYGDGSLSMHNSTSYYQVSYLFQCLVIAHTYSTSGDKPTAAPSISFASVPSLYS